jgi:putative ABC transport system permease protein
VLAFTLLLSTLTGVLFGLAPASSATGHDLNEPLKEGGRGSAQDGRSRMRHVLIACEVALAMVVLCGAGLMMQTMSKLLAVDPGFDPKNVLTLDISLPQVNTYYGPPVHARFCQQLQESVAALPGVVSVGAVAHLPMEGNAGRGFNIEGQPVPPPEQKTGASYSVACPGYFRTMRIPMIAGREFTDQDTVNAPQVIVINEAMAKKFWPNQDAIGKRISMDIKDPQEPWLTVVGVAGNVRHWGLDNDVQPQFFRPYTQAAWPWMSIVVRSKSNPMALLSPIKRAITQIEPEHPTSGVETLESIVSGSVGARRFPTLLLASFALLALVLAAVGIVGLVSYAVTQRTHEIGIRIALGARGGDVLALFVRRSMVWVFGGVVAGIVASLGVTQLVKSMLFGVRPTDPIVLSAAGALLVAIALLASYLPARRATKLDPLEALRCE